MKVYPSPLRYPGGKSRFAPFIASIMKGNSLSGHYVEPYAGGAGLAISLLTQGIVSHIHINDADPAVYDFWNAVTKHPNEILKLLDDIPVTIDQWYYWRDVLRGNIKVSSVERGFATLFMNRTNRSGILKGGVIGGYAQDGKYKLDARFKKEEIKKRIENIAKWANNISVYNEDALELLKQCSQILPPNSLIYLDPPYYIKGKGLYRNFYNHQDHVEIARFICDSSFKIPWIVSYDNVKEIQEMYASAKKYSYELNYTAQKRYVGSEIMFFSNILNVPEHTLYGTFVA